MTLATVAMTAPSEKPKKKRNDQAVKIERSLAKIANIIAQNREISAAELLSELLRAPLEKEWLKELKKLNQQGGEILD